MFQSSPGFGAGRYSHMMAQYSVMPRFNPRPALGPGATVQLQLDHTTKKFFVNARTGNEEGNF